MSQEPLAQAYSAGVRWRVTCAHKLNALQGHPFTVMVKETPSLHQLPQEHDDRLSAIFILLGQVELVAKDNKPMGAGIGLSVRLADQAFGRVADLTVLSKCLENKLRGRCRAE